MVDAVGQDRELSSLHLCVPTPCAQLRRTELLVAEPGPVRERAPELHAVQDGGVARGELAVGGAGAGAMDIP